MKRKSRTSSKRSSDALKIAETPASFFNSAQVGKYYRQYAASRHVVKLAPDVAREFNNDDEVNAALRIVVQLRSIGGAKRRKSA